MKSIQEVDKEIERLTSDAKREEIKPREKKKILNRIAMIGSLRNYLELKQDEPSLRRQLDEVVFKIEFIRARFLPVIEERKSKGLKPPKDYSNNPDLKKLIQQRNCLTYLLS